MSAIEASTSAVGGVASRSAKVVVASPGAGVAVTTSTKYRFRVVLDDVGATAKFYINNVLVATHTTNLPASATNMGHQAQFTNLTAGARGFHFSRIAARMD